MQRGFEMTEGVCGIGGMIVTGETEVVRENLYTLWFGIE